MHLIFLIKIQHEFVLKGPVDQLELLHVMAWYEISVTWMSHAYTTRPR